MTVQNAINHARHARTQATTAEAKLDEIAKAIEALATAVGNIGRQLDDVQYKVRSLAR